MKGRVAKQTVTDYKGIFDRQLNHPLCQKKSRKKETTKTDLSDARWIPLSPGGNSFFADRHRS